MNQRDRIRIAQILREAEGYLELSLPRHALEALQRAESLGLINSHGLYLRGEALRELQQFSDAIGPLTQAAELAPSNVQIWLALGWCQKRAGRIDLAIEALEQAEDIDAQQAIIPYNLACYWCLAKNKQQTLEHLARAFDLDPNYRDLVPKEADFDALRDDPDFQALLYSSV